ncbi:MAG: hypothetical protein IPM35_23630 [Myxococcales bacterium]|nr:hypothetical protein [Myxococcales bacterium]
MSAFMGEVDRSLRWRAERELGLASVADAHTGGVAAVQRTDSALLDPSLDLDTLRAHCVRDADGSPTAQAKWDAGLLDTYEVKDQIR